MLHHVRFQSWPPMVTSMAPLKSHVQSGLPDSVSTGLRYCTGQNSPCAQRSVAWLVVESADMGLLGEERDPVIVNDGAEANAHTGNPRPSARSRRALRTGGMHWPMLRQLPARHSSTVHPSEARAEDGAIADAHSAIAATPIVNRCNRRREHVGSICELLDASSLGRCQVCACTTVPTNLSCWARLYRLQRVAWGSVLGCSCERGDGLFRMGVCGRVGSHVSY